MSDSTGPSKEAMEAASEYLGKPSPVIDQQFYEHETEKLALVLDSFAGRARLGLLQSCPHDSRCSSLHEMAGKCDCWHGYFLAQLEKEKG